MNRFGILLLVGLVTANDLAVGPKNVGHKIYDEKKEASPAIWRQVSNVTVNATKDEVINSINIIDLRPEKDGEANIIEGGVGHQNVTIELKSPAVFRGYDFQIQIFAVPASEYKGVLPENKVSPTPTTHHPESTSNHVPILTGKDENTTRLVRKSDEHPAGPPVTDAKTLTPTTKSDQHTPKPLTNEYTPKVYEVPAVVKEVTKSNDHISTTPKELTSEKPASTHFDSTPILPTTEDEAQIIDVNGQSPPMSHHNPPITHEEQGKRDNRDTHPSQAAVTPSHEHATPKLKCNDAPKPTVVSPHPHPTTLPAKAVPTKHNAPATTIAPQVNHVAKTIGTEKGNNEGYFVQEEIEEFKEKQNVEMLPLPYVNH